MAASLDSCVGFYCEAEQVRLDLKCSRQCGGCRKDQHGTELKNEAAAEISLLDQLKALNEDEIVAGYRSGWDDPSIPIGKCKAFMHGWLNAQVDKGRMKPSDAMRKLAHEYIKAR